MRSLEYEERLKVWGLTTLEERRSRGDLIQMYTIHHGLEKTPGTQVHNPPRFQTQELKLETIFV